MIVHLKLKPPIIAKTLLQCYSVTVLQYPNKVDNVSNSGLPLLIMMPYVVTVCYCVCVFIKLHITARSGLLVILAILCHSH